MSLVFDSSKKFRLLANSTDSPGALWRGLGPATAMSNWFWVEIPASPPAADQCIFDMTTANGTADSQLKCIFKTDGTVRLDSWDDDRNTDYTATDSALAPGWHCLAFHHGGGNMPMFVDGANLQSAQISSGTKPDSPLTLLSIGRSLAAGSTDYFDGKLLQWVACHTSTLSATEQAGLYGSIIVDDVEVGTPGVPVADPVATINGSVGWAQLGDSLAGGGTSEVTIAFTCGITPTFADDSDLTTNAWTAPAIQTIPNSRRLSIIPRSFNADFIFFGDSFTGIANDRMPIHFWNEAARKASTNLKKYAGGHNETGNGSGNPMETDALAAGGTASDSDIDDTAGYVLQDGNYMDMPIGGGMVEINFGSGPTGTELNSIRIQNVDDSEFSGPIASWIASGDAVDFTPLIHCYDDDDGQLPNIDMGDGSGAGTTYPISEASGLDANGDAFVVDILNSVPTQTLTSAETDGRMIMFSFAGDVASTANNKFLCLAGGVADNTSVASGVGLLTIHDSSWSVSGHGDTLSAVVGTQRRYSDAEIVPVLKAYHDTTRKTVFVMAIATESASMKTDVETWITRMRARATLAGITNYCFLLVSWPPSGASGSATTDRTNTEDAAVRFDTIATEQTDVAHVSLLRLLNGAHLHDEGLFAGNESTDAPYQAIKDYDTANGTNFQTGSPGREWLGAGDLHPANYQSANALAVVMVNEMYARGGAQENLDLGVKDSISVGIVNPIA